MREQTSDWASEIARYKSYAEKFDEENAALRERAENAERRITELEEENAGLLMASVAYAKAATEAERERDAVVRDYQRVNSQLADTMRERDEARDALKHLVAAVGRRHDH